MYLALFMSPWILMYGLSTFTMNHRPFFSQLGSESSTYEIEKEVPYDGVVFDGEVPANTVAEAILAHLGLEGAYSVRGGVAEGQLVVFRSDPVTPRRITYRLDKDILVVERERFRATSFLERLHRKRGYDQPFLSDQLWALTVDLTILAVVIWAATGLWIWWRIRLTRRTGFAFLVLGWSLFGFFLCLI